MCSKVHPDRKHGAVSACEPNVNTRPLISVIITAYNRKEFLRQAVSSVLNQTISRCDYEVVVTKNFQTEFDGEWLSEGVKILSFQGSRWGERVAHALRYCRGEVVCFLDDDDLFMPHKLKIVAKEFTENPRLAFMHHLQEAMNRSGRPLNAVPFGVNPKGRVSVSGGNHDHHLPVLLDPFYFGNASSICVRRSLAYGYLEVLRDLNSPSDEFWVVASLNSGLPMLFTSERLTRYRVHPSSSNIPLSDFEEYFITLSSYFERRIRDYNLFLSMTENSRLRRAILFKRSLLSLQLCYVSDLPASQKLLYLLRYYMYLFSVNLDLGEHAREYALSPVVRSAIASLIFPKYVRKRIYNIRTNFGVR